MTSALMESAVQSGIKLWFLTLLVAISLSAFLQTTFATPSSARAKNRAPKSIVTVFAAASLTDALKKIATQFENRTGHEAIFNFGSSSMLARQIQEGAPADIFFSADEAKMDRLERDGLIQTNSRISRLSNSLVIVVPADSSFEISSATNLLAGAIRRVALADPRTVPAGIYAKAYLEQLNLWGAISPKVVPTDNVRAALAAVESGNAQAGIVYKTDAALSRKVKVALAIAPKEGPNISYPVAKISNARHAKPADAFLQHLRSAEAEKIFVEFGFVVRD